MMLAGHGIRKLKYLKPQAYHPDLVLAVEIPGFDTRNHLVQRQLVTDIKCQAPDIDPGTHLNIPVDIFNAGGCQRSGDTAFLLD